MSKEKIYFILALCLLPFLLSATTWYVDGSVTHSGNGLTPGGAFKTIGEAVDALSDGDTVEVAPYTYNETVNFANHYFDLIGENHLTTIINGGGSSDGIIIRGGNPAITGLSTISDFTVKQCYTSVEDHGGGIYIENRNVTIEDCIIEYNVSDGSGGGIFFTGNDDYTLTIYSSSVKNNESDECGGGLYFAGSDTDELIIIECEFDINTAIEDGGGIYCQGNGDQKITLKGSQICNNECLGKGGGVFASGTDTDDISIDFENLTIFGNTAYDGADGGSGGGIYCDYADMSAGSFENLLIYDNIADIHGAGIALYNPAIGFIINKVTVADNENWGTNDIAGICCPAGCIITNSIVYGNTYIGGMAVQVQNGGTTEYCCIEDDDSGTNIDDDPEFVNAASDDYRIEDYSPCIDMGDTDSDYNDPDNSRADMGYKYVDQDEYVFTGEGGPTIPVWKWLSYPRLPVGTTNQNVGDDVSSEYVRHHWNTMPSECGWYYLNAILLYGEYDEENYNWNWEPYPVIPDFNSTQGYKVYRKGTSSNHYSPGNRCEDDTEIDVDEGENWIGYFLEDSQLPSDAFPSAVLDDLNYIQTQSWSWVKDGHGNWPEDIYTINYGDLVIIDAEDGDYSFVWETPSRIEPVIRPMPEHYTYLEEIDYQPIYIDFGENDLPLEVAVFVEDICKGAAVVDGQVTQLCAYLLECDPGLQVEFELYYDNRQYGDRIRNYDIETAFCSENNSNLKTGMPGDVYYVSFRNIEFEVPEPPINLKCYPNPFNPELTISFSLSKESEVDLVIYNSKGQKIKTMVNELFRPADYTLVWNGTDDRNRPVSSGVYFIRLQVGDVIVNDKAVLLK